MDRVQGYLEWGEEVCATLLRGRSRGVLQLAVFVLGFVGCGLISVALGAFETWDLRNYQYYSPHALLNGRFDFDYAAGQIQTFLNPLPFVPFYWITTHFEPRVAGFLMGGFHGLSVGFLFSIALALLAHRSPLSRVTLALACTVVGVYGPTYLGMLGGSGSDNVSCLFVMAGVYFMVRGMESADSRRGIVGGAALIGIAAGLKLVGAIFVIAGGAAVLARREAWRSRAATVGSYAAATIVGVLVSRGFWVFYLWKRFESPLFPFYNDVFQSPYFSPSNFADNRYLPVTLAQKLFLPFYFFTENNFTHMTFGFRDVRYPLLYVCVVLALGALAIRRLRSRGGGRVESLNGARVFLIAFLVVSYVVWQTKFAILRYIMPVELLAPLAIVLLVGTILPRGKSQALVVTMALVGVTVAMQPRNVPRQAWTSTYIEVEAPVLENPGATMILLANNGPWSYVIPFFDPAIRFVGIGNRFAVGDGGTRHRAAQEMWEWVRGHEGPLYVLSTREKFRAAMSNLPGYTQVRGQGTRLDVPSRHQEAPLYLWPVEAR